MSGYPIRGIVTADWLYLKNFEPDRWPAGNPETGYLNTDASPTKTTILDGRTSTATHHFWSMGFGKRGPRELFDLKNDPDCLKNLADDPKFGATRDKLDAQLTRELTSQSDPRIAGHGEVFDRYPYADPTVQNFYERFQRGEKLKAGWVIPSDFEEGPVE